MPGRILLLNGAPSSGKTTLARAIQAASGQPLWHRSLDDFRAGYPERFWQSDDGALFTLVLHGYLSALRSLADTGVHLIAEAVITPARADMYLDTLRGTPVMFVGVRCALPVAQARELARTDRARQVVDLDVPAFEAVHRHTYDMEVDTMSTNVHEQAKRVLNAFEATPHPTAFDAMRKRN